MSESTGTTSPVNDARTTPWPEGVVARYLTVAGATVDLTDNGTDGQCHGCQDTFDDGPYITNDPRTVRHWAQEHASECRALPRPAVTR